MPNAEDKSYVDDKAYELGTVVPINIRNIALSMYVRMSENGGRIPSPLQDYVNRGLQRIADGEEPPFPVTKAGKLNKFFIKAWVGVFSKEIGEAEAIKEIARNQNVTARTIRNACAGYSATTPEHLIYYVADLMKEMAEMKKEIADMENKLMKEISLLSGKNKPAIFP